MAAAAAAWVGSSELGLPAIHGGGAVSALLNGVHERMNACTTAAGYASKFLEEWVGVEKH